MRFLASLCVFLFFLISQVQGQEKCRWVPQSDLLQGIQVDSLSAVEESIRLTDANGKSFDFIFSLEGNSISVPNFDQTLPDSLRLCYRTFRMNFGAPLARRTLSANYDSMAFFRDNRETKQEVFDFSEEIFPATNLYKTGSLTRGISFGNTQNVFVNSALNLQLEGAISDQLNIRASITDQNVPFQPEGNTQQIQDFDNVLIELYSDKFSLAAGDVVLQQRRSEFLRYYKNVQGLQFTSKYKLSDSWIASSQAFASIAKGKFASIQLPIIEGVLGPYLINGPENEQFVIIMANSERVFLDGKQLKRGFNEDYVIDYNQAEITFTPRILITEYSRVRIDFEYAERNYSRSIIGANHSQTNGNVEVYMNYYQESDNRNRPLFSEFSQEELALLASVGDQTELARIPRIDSVAFDPNRILYEKITEIDGDGKTLVYYQYSVDPEVAKYDLSFSQVGQGRGDYIRQTQLANGTVYEYVPRIDGAPQGNYSILTQLPAPDSKRMITAGSRVKLGEKESAYTELALSSVDENLFSTIDDEDNQGLAWKLGIQSHDRKLGLLPKYHLNTDAEFELNSTNFSFIDRFRYIEFDRDWGLSQESLESAAAERLFKANIHLQKDIKNEFKYGIYLRNKRDVLKGIQHFGTWRLHLGERLQLDQDFFALNSNQGSLKSNWQRYTGRVSYTSRFFVPGYQFSLDQNALRSAETDSVLSTAMNFKEHLVFLKSNDSLDYQFQIDAAWREDRAPFAGKFENDTEAFTSNFTFRKQWKNHNLRSSFTFRELKYLFRDLPTETTVMGKLDYQGSLGKNLIRNDISYAIGNGRELQREFVYILAPNGDGTHTWRDDNGDGIQQLNEFYLAINPEEKEYIKIFVPTDTYVQAYTSLLNYRFQARFPNSWKGEGGVRGFLQKFSNTSSLSVEKKVTSDNFGDRINPFIGGISREEILRLRQVIRSSFFFNRASAKYGFDLSLFDSQFKQLLSGGFEDLIQKDWKLNIRYNFDAIATLRLIGSAGIRSSASDFLENRNYTIDQYKIGPEFAWQPSPYFRSTARYSFSNKENIENVEFNERAQTHKIGVDLRFAKAIKTTLTGDLQVILIDYNGEVNSPVGYEMLQALTPGTNITWTLNWLQKIGEGLQLNVVYEGRNSEGLDRVVHVGRMQVSALF